MYRWERATPLNWNRAALSRGHPTWRLYRVGALGIWLAEVLHVQRGARLPHAWEAWVATPTGWWLAANACLTPRIARRYALQAVLDAAAKEAAVRLGQ